jgi:hypothetical protein
MRDRHHIPCHSMSRDLGISDFPQVPADGMRFRFGEKTDQAVRGLSSRAGSLQFGRAKWQV